LAQAAAATLFGTYSLNRSLAVYGNEVQAANQQERAGHDRQRRLGVVLSAP
jgi:hypothetical protein